MKHRALIIGCGRMGAERDHSPTMLYSHPAAYRALSARVELVGFVDRVLARAEWAATKWGGLFAGDDIRGAIIACRPDIVSICTPPSDRREPLEACARFGEIKGVWCEKPYACDLVPKIPVQVNYIRRFDSRHRDIAARRAADEDRPADLFVICANDIHTTPHFTDLARFWRLAPWCLHYLPFHGPALYVLREAGEKPGRYAGWRDEVFVGGGVESGFMEAALGNLLDAVEGGAALESPAESAIESETWAKAIIEGNIGGEQ